MSAQGSDPALDGLFTPGENEHLTSKSDESVEQDGKGAFSWHEHVYKKLTTRPTPHFIENILGLPGVKVASRTDKDGVRRVTKMNCVSVDVNSAGLARRSLTVGDLNEPLNLSIRSEEVRIKTGNKGRLCK